MEFALSEEQALIQDSARRMVERDIRPVLDRNDPDVSLPKEEMLRIYKVLAPQGLTAPRLSAEEGGGGLSMVNYGLMYEQLPPWLAISVMGHECTISRIHAESTPEQRKRFLPDLLAGRKLCGSATSEPGAGSDPRGISTRMRIEGDEIVINGRKMWITNGSVADIVAVACVGETDAKGRTTLKRVIVEPAKANVEIREIETTGLRQGHLAEAVFEDCRVPRGNLLEAGGDAARMLTVTWNGNRPLVGLAAVHLAQKALDMACDYAGIRVQFDKPISAFQLTQKKLADMSVSLGGAALLAVHLGRLKDQHRIRPEQISVGKLNNVREAIAIARECRTILGANGISLEYSPLRHANNLESVLTYEGTEEMHLLSIGAAVTGINAFR